MFEERKPTSDSPSSFWVAGSWGHVTGEDIGHIADAALIIYGIAQAAYGRYVARVQLNSPNQ